MLANSMLSTHVFLCLIHPNILFFYRLIICYKGTLKEKKVTKFIFPHEIYLILCITSNVCYVLNCVYFRCLLHGFLNIFFKICIGYFLVHPGF